MDDILDRITITDLKKEAYHTFKKLHLQLKNTKDFSSDRFIEMLDNLDKTDSKYFCIRLKNCDEIIGCGKFFYDLKLGNNKGFIDDIIIDKNYRGKKLGSFLVNIILEHAKTKDCYIVYVISENGKKNFYNKLYFKNDRLIFNYDLF